MEYFMKKVSHAQVDENKTSREDIKIRIIQSAINILKESGRDALTTRGVAEAAEIQAPTIYRLFGDKQGLIDAVTEYGYVMGFEKKKMFKPSSNPIDDLRQVWNLKISFGLENPELYTLMFGDPRAKVSKAVEKSRQQPNELVHRIAVTGQLKVSEKRAVELIHSVNSGVILTLLSTPEDKRDIKLAKDACEAVIKAITNDSQPLNKTEIKSTAITLKAMLPNVKSLTDGERHLLTELLERISIQG